MYISWNWRNKSFGLIVFIENDDPINFEKFTNPGQWPCLNGSWDSLWIYRNQKFEQFVVVEYKINDLFIKQSTFAKGEYLFRVKMSVFSTNQRKVSTVEPSTKKNKLCKQFVKAALPHIKRKFFTAEFVSANVIRYGCYFFGNFFKIVPLPKIRHSNRWN